VNRLSDLLWLFGRKLEHEAGVNASLRDATGKAGNRFSRHGEGDVATGKARGAVLHGTRSGAVGDADVRFGAGRSQPHRLDLASITETLFALGLGSRVVGVSIYCRFPEEVKRCRRSAPS
jgi:hypothetical protein